MPQSWPVVPFRPHYRPEMHPSRDCSPSPAAKSARTATRAGLWALAGGIAASKCHRGGTAADAFAAKKPCALFLAQTRPEKGPFGAKTLPRLQQEWPVRPISRKCVRRTDRACVLVDKRQRREVVRSKMGMGRWSMVSTNLVCTGEVASTEGSLYKPGRNRRFRPLSGRFVHEMREWRGNRRTNEVCTRWGDEDERLMND